MEAFSSDSSSSPSTSTELNWYKTVSSAPPKRPAGRIKFKETRHPIYKGVRQRGAAGRWVCELREPNKKSRIWLGTYRTAELAARAHDFAAIAAIALRGHAACLNFGGSAWLLNVPKSFSSTKDLVRLAAKAVEGLGSSLPDMEVASPVSVDSVTSLESDAFDVFKGGELDFAMVQEFYYDGLMADTMTSCNWDDLEYSAASLWSYTF